MERQKWVPASTKPDNTQATEEQNKVTGDTKQKEIEQFNTFLNDLNHYRELLDTHRRWVDADDAWKKARKDHNPAAAELYAVRTQLGKEKDKVHDHIAKTAHDLAWETGIIKELDLDTLGAATLEHNYPELSVEWLKGKRKGIGGSDISKVIGMHWTSKPGAPVFLTGPDLYEVQKGIILNKATPEDPKSQEGGTSGVTYRGHMWEPALIARYALMTGEKVAVSKGTFKGDEPFLLINTDGILLDNKGKPKGIIECKTSLRSWTWQNGVPLNYRAQVLYYLHTTGLDYAVVLAHFDDGRFGHWVINRGETIDGTTKTATIPQLLPTLREFWSRVEACKTNFDPLIIDPTLRGDIIKSTAALTGEAWGEANNRIAAADGEKVADKIHNHTTTHINPINLTTSRNILSLNIRYEGDIEQESSIMFTSFETSLNGQEPQVFDVFDVHAVNEQAEKADTIIIKDARIINALMWYQFPLALILRNKPIIDLQSVKKLTHTPVPTTTDNYLKYTLETLSGDNLTMPEQTQLPTNPAPATVTPQDPDSALDITGDIW